MIAAVMTAALVQAAPVQSRGIYCALFELNVEGQIRSPSDPIDLSFFMSGHIADPNGRSILKVYDPARLLAGNKLDSVSFDPQVGGGTYAVWSPKTDASPGYLLMLKPREERGEFDATFGSRDRTNRKMYRGRCFGPVGPMDEAAFDAENKR